MEWVLVGLSALVGAGLAHLRERRRHLRHVEVIRRIYTL